MLGLLYFIAAAFFQISAWGLSSTVIKQGLEKGGVIPDVFHNEFEPESEIRITYHMTKQLRMGMEVTAEDTKNPPHVWFSKINDESQYTLIMMDPDAVHRPYLHWIVTNIDGQRPASDVENEEHQHTSYSAPAPPAGTGAHRYVFSVYEQAQVNQTSFLPETFIDRSEFDVAKFTEENGLRLVGALYMVQENLTPSS
ncbi:hypothetical protein INT45_009725 [Circinella minor]|uniref:Phosphatidylethanolamine-binding protein n=1 Tax=Circinella minor TaxID=1195481 RepID=A0A8H7S3G6_9FUNG|nr:hypothetical protein INT45_009725 [Circinella minor]